jgi:hypothetical protein
LDQAEERGMEERGMEEIESYPDRKHHRFETYKNLYLLFVKIDASSCETYKPNI